MRSWPLLLSPLLALLGCPAAAPNDRGDDDAGDDDDATEEPTPCTYPEGAVEPMALGEVLAPYSWPTAIHADGRTARIVAERSAPPISPISANTVPSVSELTRRLRTEPAISISTSIRPVTRK